MLDYIVRAKAWPQSWPSMMKGEMIGMRKKKANQGLV